MHRRVGVILHAPRVKKRFKQYVGRRVRVSGNVGISLASIVETVIRQLYREAASHVKPSKKNGETILIQPIHIAMAKADKRSMIYKALPDKVAGIYTKTFK